MHRHRIAAESEVYRLPLVPPVPVPRGAVLELAALAEPDPDDARVSRMIVEYFQAIEDFQALHRPSILERDDLFACPN